ncbi:MAG: serine O-acetyltransferase [Anaerolineales bacterium]|jgi:serine O-acetyltransferase
MFKTLRQDIQAIFDRDPAARSVSEILLFYPGLHAIWMHRLAHWLWSTRLHLIARGLSHLNRWLTGIEIHPAARIGPGFFIDHGMGTVIGETSVIGAHVTLYHNVTLGGVSWEKVKRHPTLEDHVVVGAGAQILGPIRIGAYSRIGANSVVIKDIPRYSIVIGVPGRVRMLGEEDMRPIGHEDLQHDRLPDPPMELYRTLARRVDALEQSLAELIPEDEDVMAKVWTSNIAGDGSHI